MVRSSAAGICVDWSLHGSFRIHDFVCWLSCDWCYETQSLPCVEIPSRWTYLLCCCKYLKCKIHPSLFPISGKITVMAISYSNYLNIYIFIFFQFMTIIYILQIVWLLIFAFLVITTLIFTIFWGLCSNPRVQSLDECINFTQFSKFSHVDT